MKKKIFPVLFMIFSVAFMFVNIYFMTQYMDEIKFYKRENKPYALYYYSALFIDSVLRFIIDGMFFAINMLVFKTCNKSKLHVKKVISTLLILIACMLFIIAISTLFTAYKYFMGIYNIKIFVYLPLAVVYVLFAVILLIVRKKINSCDFSVKLQSFIGDVKADEEKSRQSEIKRLEKKLAKLKSESEIELIEQPMQINEEEPQD